jgi:predicted dehydrogenase
MHEPLNVGMIGYGFMARAHSNAWRQVGRFFPGLARRPRLQAVAARDAAKVSAFADVWDYDSVETDWRRLVARQDIELIDICVPNHLHAEIALAAAAAGKMVVCEKPLAMSAAEGERMVAAVERAGVPNLVCYNYRRVPAVTLARQLIDEGRIGRPFHYRAQFLQDWTISPDLPQGGPALWRLDANVSGSGVTGDLLAHCIDTAIWLNGPIVRVMAETETFVKERPHQETGKIEPVGIDDACMVMARFENGSLGLFESTRYARGHKALKTFELNGEAGSLAFDLHDPQWLSFFEYRDPTSAEKTASHTAGWRRIHVTNAEHPYMSHWWVPGLTIGYEHSFIHTFADFLHGLETGTLAEPTFRTALATQRICDAILRSAKAGSWVESGITSD